MVGEQWLRRMYGEARGWFLVKHFPPDILSHLDQRGRSGHCGCAQVQFSFFLWWASFSCVNLFYISKVLECSELSLLPVLKEWGWLTLESIRISGHLHHKRNMDRTRKMASVDPCIRWQIGRHLTARSFSISAAEADLQTRKDKSERNPVLENKAVPCFQSTMMTHCILGSPVTQGLSLLVEVDLDLPYWLDGSAVWSMTSSVPAWEPNSAIDTASCWLQF